MKAAHVVFLYEKVRLSTSWSGERQEEKEKTHSRLPHVRLDFFKQMRRTVRDTSTGDDDVDLGELANGVFLREWEAFGRKKGWKKRKTSLRTS